MRFGTLCGWFFGIFCPNLVLAPIPYTSSHFSWEHWAGWKSFLLFSDEVCNSKWSYKSLKFLQSPSLGWLFMHTQILPDSIRRMTIILCSLLQFPHLSKTYILAPSDIGRKWNVHKTFSEPCLYIQLTSFVQGDRTIFRESSPLHFFM